MIKFKDYLTQDHFREPLPKPSVTVRLKDQSSSLSLLLDKKDVILKASYAGEKNPWLGSLCSLVEGKSVHQAEALSFKDWDSHFQQDALYWELKSEHADELFVPQLELLKAALDVFLGREHLYQETSPLVCMCFGVREAEILKHIKSQKDPSVASLQASLKAGMGCRTCVSDLKRYLSLNNSQKNHHYKERSRASWILQADHLLNGFPERGEWGMEIESFKGKQIVVTYTKTATQKEAEVVAKDLQLFLAGALDADLAFFLRRARQASNALG